MRDRDVVQQMMGPESRIDAGVLHFTYDRDSLGRVLDDEHGNLRVFEEAPVDELLANQSLGVPGRETLQVKRAHERKNHVTRVAYA